MALKPIIGVAAIGAAMWMCAAAAVAQDRTAPFAIEEIFGSRPVVDATLNGQPFRMIVHSNAGSYVQINHAEAARLNVADMVHQGAYGITAPGQVSTLGRDDGVLQSLTVAGVERANVPVAVFERVAEPKEGMLGLAWLTENEAIIDYDANQIVLPRDKTEADSYGATLESRGYEAHRLERDPTDGRYVVTATVRGEPLILVVSTVASNVLDTAAAERAQVALGPVSGRWGGPGGAVGETRTTARPLVIQIDDWRSPPTRFSAYDIYAYSAKPRPYLAETGRAGDLGADFLIANRAVVDFGQRRLYLKAASTPDEVMR